MLVVDNTKLMSENSDLPANSGDEELDYEYDCDDGWLYEENREQRRKEAHLGPQTVNLLTVLHLNNPSSNVTNLIRALLCQAVSYHSNSKARTAAASGTMLDLGNAGNSVMSIHQGLTLH